MSEEGDEKKNSGILSKAIALSERMLDSNKSANVLIIVCVMLSVLLALAIGITLTRATAPVHQIEISN